MPLSLTDVRTAPELPLPRILVYGVAGIGKTTFAAGAPAPVFLCLEEGLGTLSVPHFPLLRTFDAVNQALFALYAEPHEYRTLVVDSVDRLETLLWAQACKDNGWENIETPGYGKGYVIVLDRWCQYLNALNDLRKERGMTIIQIAHTTIKRFDSPEHAPYDRYIIKLHDRASTLLQEQSDVVLFANYKISTLETDVGFKKTVRRGIGSGERVLYTSERPAFVAKNRFSLPDELPLSWSAFAEHMPHFTNHKQESPEE